jgi:hypothetical protein
MFKKKAPLLAGAAVVAALFAGTAGYTASNTQPPSQVLGYGTTTVSGATATAISYTLSTSGSVVNDVNLTLTGDTSTSNVSVSFNTGNTPSTCGTGTYVSPSTTYTCNVSSLSQATSGITATNVIVN